MWGEPIHPFLYHKTTKKFIPSRAALPLIGPRMAVALFLPMFAGAIFPNHNDSEVF